VEGCECPECHREVTEADRKEIGLCDFCAAPDPEWDYPARDFGPFIIMSALQVSQGSWAAWVVCHHLIQNEQWDQLVDQCFNQLVLAELPHTEAVAEGIKGFIRTFHALFRKHRLDSGPYRIGLFQ